MRHVILILNGHSIEEAIIPVTLKHPRQTLQCQLLNDIVHHYMCSTKNYTEAAHIDSILRKVSLN